MKKRTTFYSKLLLFGEHAIVIGSKGLALPYHHHGGKWIFQLPETEAAKKSGQALNGFLQYLEEKEVAQQIADTIDLRSFRLALQSGLYFDSDIPQGYGLGSSGALCAAFLYEFGKKNAVAALDVNQLRNLLALLESYFHGSSSGVDPLISYINKPLLLLSKKEAETVVLPQFKGNHGMVFLLDTGISRQTGPLVNLFLKRCENPAYRQLIDEQLTPFNESGILAFLLNDIPAFEEAWTAISEFQLRHFEPHTPKAFRGIWQSGLETGDYFLKLCGAGGGGFFLGFARKDGRGHAELPEGALGFMEV